MADTEDGGRNLKRRESHRVRPNHATAGLVEQVVRQLYCHSDRTTIPRRIKESLKVFPSRGVAFGLMDGCNPISGNSPTPPTRTLATLWSRWVPAFWVAGVRRARHNGRMMGSVHPCFVDEESERQPLRFPGHLTKRVILPLQQATPRPRGNPLPGIPLLIASNVEVELEGVIASWSARRVSDRRITGRRLHSRTRRH